MRAIVPYSQEARGIAFWLAKARVASIHPRSTASDSQNHGAEGVSTQMAAMLIVRTLVWRHGRCE